jgi:hypothetical protein
MRGDPTQNNWSSEITMLYMTHGKLISSSHCEAQMSRAFSTCAIVHVPPEQLVE